jgi:hypothetical protein
MLPVEVEAMTDTGTTWYELTYGVWSSIFVSLSMVKHGSSLNVLVQLLTKVEPNCTKTVFERPLPDIETGL